MNEKLPQIEKIIDRKYPESTSVISPSFSYKDVERDLEYIQPVLKDFFSKIIIEQPDYLILLDKGARVFGTPFARYLNDLQLSKKPKVMFWNDDSYKRDFSDPAEAQKELTKNFIDSKPEEDFQNKKLFIVDETIYSGTGARMLKDFFDKNNINGHYFAFTNTDNSSFDDELGYQENIRGIEGDKRFTVYDKGANADFFPQDVGELYVTDMKNPATGITETKRRFEYVTDFPENSAPAEIVEEKKALAYEVKRKVGELIYASLQEMGLSSKG